MFSTDTFVRGAKTPCEDYVLAGTDCLALSDGCSSSRHTDVGARILCHTVMRTLPREYGIFKREDILSITGVWDAVSELLGLDGTALDATLGIIQVVSDSIFVRLWGDGVIFYRFFGEKDVRWISVEYEANMPFYPRYLSRRDLMQYFEKENRRHITYSTAGYPQGVLSHFETSHETLWTRPISQIEFVGIASDGIRSLKRPSQDDVVPLEEVLPKLCEFKGTGKRLQRRMNRLLNEYAKQGVVPYDDISVGVLFHDRETGA